MNFIMKVRTCRYAGISDVSDNLPLIYVFAFFYAERTHMRIACIHTVLVADNNVISKTCIIDSRLSVRISSCIEIAFTGEQIPRESARDIYSATIRSSTEYSYEEGGDLGTLKLEIF